jgi:uracil-DNA glycosylase family 4
MFILQDWTSYDPNPSSQRIQKSTNFAAKEFEREFGYHPQTQTNIFFNELLHDIFNLERKDIYMTNLFVFIKFGQMNSKIPAKDLRYSAAEYTLKEIMIINPKMIVCLGSGTFYTLLKLISNEKVKFKDSLNYAVSFNNSVIYGAPHTSPQGIANARGKENVRKIYRNLYERYLQIKAK